MARGNFKGHATDVTRQVSVNDSGEVIDRGALPKVRVYHNLEFFEFFEDAIDRRRTDFRSQSLNRARNRFSGHVLVVVEQDLDDRALRKGYPMMCLADRREDVFEVIYIPCHLLRL